MDTEATGAEKTLPEQQDPRKPGRPPAIMMTSTTELSRPQNNLKSMSKENTSSEIHAIDSPIVIKEMADYSTMKSYLDKNSLHHFILPKIFKTSQGRNPSPSRRHTSERFATALRT
jgi:hypothetical protein